MGLLELVFSLSRFLSVNQQFVGAKVNNFYQQNKYSFKKLTNL